MKAVMNVISHHTAGQLQSLFRTQKDGRLARRIQGVYLAKTGRTCPEIMAVTGTARRTVQQWVARYNRGGLEGLFDKPRSGQPTKLPRDRQEEFCRRIEAGPTLEDGVSVLNGPAIRRILEREFGQTYTLWGVRDLLGRLGYSYLCSRPRHEQAGPIRQDEFKKTSRPSWARHQTSIPEKSSKSGSRMKPGLGSKEH
jgi:transposase